jgi:hypothetical protein
LCRSYKNIGLSKGIDSSTPILRMHGGSSDGNEKIDYQQRASLCEQLEEQADSACGG